MLKLNKTFTPVSDETKHQIEAQQSVDEYAADMIKRDKLIMSFITDTGLDIKYNVTKKDTGELVDGCIVLIPQGDPIAIYAVLTYADKTPNRKWASDLYGWILHITGLGSQCKIGDILYAKNPSSKEVCQYMVSGFGGLSYDHITNKVSNMRYIIQKIGDPIGFDDISGDLIGKTYFFSKDDIPMIAQSTSRNI
jgi:hypothetical protein